MSDLTGLVALPDVVAAPEPVPVAHGLVQTAIEVVEPIAQRGGMQVESWTGGFYFMPDQCEDGGTWVPCVTEKEADLNPENASTGDTGSGSGEVDQVKSEYVGLEWPLYFPPVIEASFTCSTTGFEMAEYAARARRLLERVESSRMAEELWTGEQMRVSRPGNVSFVGSVTADGILNPGWSELDPTAITPVSGRVAMALIAEALSSCGRGNRGLIHVPSYLADLLGGLHNWERDGTRLVTRARGDWIVADPGYPRRAGPIVTSADQVSIPTAGVNESWVFATGMVNYRRGRIKQVPGERDLAQSIAQGMLPGDGLMHGWDNKVTFRAERYVGTVFDPCCAVAVLVDLEQAAC